MLRSYARAHPARTGDHRRNSGRANRPCDEAQKRSRRLDWSHLHDHWNCVCHFRSLHRGNVSSCIPCRCAHSCDRMHSHRKQASDRAVEGHRSQGQLRQGLALVTRRGPGYCKNAFTSAHSTGGVTVPIRVPTPTTTSTRTSIHFIEKPQKKPPFRGELTCPWPYGEGAGRLWIPGSVSPDHFLQTIFSRAGKQLLLACF